MKAPFREKDRGWCGDRRRGASMGRHSDTVEQFDGKRAHLRLVPMVDGDYDPGGVYWGGYPSQPLFCAWTKDGELVTYLRASSREGAMRQFPSSVKFYKLRRGRR